MDIVARASWDARRPEGRIYTVPWGVRTEFFVHHTYGPTTQTIRSIQEFHLDGRGWSDVGYNFLVRDDGTIYEGRGWLAVGAHCPNHNRTGIGVAYIGDNAPTPAAMRSIRWLYDEACSRAGRSLRKLCHGDRYRTDCPGPKLRAWVHAGMPVDVAETPAPTTSWTEEIVKDLPLLREGADNFDVKTLRGLLRQRGYVPPSLYGTPDQLAVWLDRTRFDAELGAVVRDFQKAKSLEADGVVGPLTWPHLLRVA
jgi:hypothetical protein